MPPSSTKNASSRDQNPGGIDLEDLYRLAMESYETIPAELRRWTEGVVIRIAEWPEDDVLEDVGLESPYDLLGLYHGIALTEKSEHEIAPPVDMIFLYRRPILAYHEDTGLDLPAILRNTLIHEIGHHFGLSDADMDRLEDAAAAEDSADAEDAAGAEDSAGAVDEAGADGETGERHRKQAVKDR